LGLVPHSQPACPLLKSLSHFCRKYRPEGRFCRLCRFLTTVSSTTCDLRHFLTPKRSLVRIQSCHRINAIDCILPSATPTTHCVCIYRRRTAPSAKRRCRLLNRSTSADLETRTAYCPTEFPTLSGKSERVAKRELLYARLGEGRIIYTEFSAGCHILQRGEGVDVEANGV